MVEEVLLDAFTPAVIPHYPKGIMVLEEAIVGGKTVLRNAAAGPPAVQRSWPVPSQDDCTPHSLATLLLGSLGG